MNEDELQRMIQRMERDALELKTAQPYSLLTVQFYVYTVENPTATAYDITYAQGDQSILTEVYSSSLVSELSYENPSRLVFAEVPERFTVGSTRPIVSIEPVNA